MHFAQSCGIAPFLDGAQALDSMLRLGGRGAVRVNFKADEAGGGVRAGVAGTRPVAMSGVTCFDIDGNAGVQAAIGALDHIEKPGLATHDAVLGPRLRGCGELFRRAVRGLRPQGPGRGRWR